VGEIRKQITDGPIWLNYGQAVTDYAIRVLEKALMDAEAELTEAQCAVTIAQGHVAGVHALIEEASGWGATKRTDEALLAQFRSSVSGRGQAPPAEHGGTYEKNHDFQEDQGIAPGVCGCGAEKDSPLHKTPGKVDVQVTSEKYSTYHDFDPCSASISHICGCGAMEEATVHTRGSG